MSDITALYCRFAYDDSDELINAQQKLLFEYASAHHFENMKFYIDQGVSGLTMDRPAFQEMMRDIESGSVKNVIAESPSRICRKSSISAQYIEEIFPSYGVSFYSAKETSSQSLFDVLLSCKK